MPVQQGALKKSFDKDFQRKLTKVLVQDADWARIVLDDVEPDMFESRVDRFIVNVVQNQSSKRGAVTRVILLNELRKAEAAHKVKPADADIIRKVVGNGLFKPPPDKTYIQEEMSGFLRHQKSVSMLMDAADAIEQGNVDAALKAMQTAVDYNPVPGGTLGTPYFARVADRIQRRDALLKNGIPTGTPIDQYLVHEGLPPGQLGTIIAPPGRGKTASLVHFGKSALLEKGCQVLYMSLELSEEMIEDRFDAAFSKIALNDLKAQSDDVQTALEVLAQKHGANLMVKHWSPGTVSVNHLRAYMQRLEHESFYPQLVLVDYADLIKPSKDYNDPYDEMGLTYTELRAMAEERKCAIWTASQANRGSMEKDDVGIEDIAESFKKAMIADVMVGFCQTKDEKKAKRMRFGIVKNRNGYDGVEIKMHVDTGTVTFRAA